MDQQQNTTDQITESTNHTEVAETTAINGHEDVDTELNKLPAKKYDETLRKVVEEHLKASFDDCVVEIAAGSAKGDNYIGVVYRVIATSPSGEKLDVIVKLPPQHQARREQFKVRPCFLRESLFYDEIYPMYRKFQEEKGIDVEKDGFNEVAKCYASMTEEPFEGLFFEDLKASGYEMFDRLKTITVDHVNLVMKSLAKMHAVAFAIKDQKPEWMEKFKEMEDYFIQETVEKEQQMDMWIGSKIKDALDSLEGHENEKLIEAAKKFFEQSFSTLYKKGTDKISAEPYAIITHGDCWNNNILYRYDDNGMPVEIRLLDFQILRYSSPVLDLAYYIFCCTTKELREKHYRSFLEVYYSTLSEFLEKLGSDPKKVFPREAFEDHLVKFGCFGLTMGLMVLEVFVTSGDDVPDLDEMADKIKEMENSKEAFNPEDLVFGKNSKAAYNERMKAVIEDLYELGYI